MPIGISTGEGLSSYVSFYMEMKKFDPVTLSPVLQNRCFLTLFSKCKESRDCSTVVSYRFPRVEPPEGFLQDVSSHGKQ